MAAKEETGPREVNVANERLVDPDKIYLPPLHIKLGLMKVFVKALNRDGEAFNHLRKQFPRLSEAKVKGVFTGPQIRDVFKDTTFSSKLNEVESNACETFAIIIIFYFLLRLFLP